ncbi:hypothetical protein QQP08_017793 [Theobroma cacao]|nr:hypothetical protein QQP08_017793 [Theobroma cacao]
MYGNNLKSIFLVRIQDSCLKTIQFALTLSASRIEQWFSLHSLPHLLLKGSSGSIISNSACFPLQKAMDTRTSNDEVPYKEEKMSKGLKRSLLVLNCTLLALGNVGGPLITRLYFLKGGKGVWISSCLEAAGWPFMMLPLTFSYLYRRRKVGPGTGLFFIKPPLFLASAVIGLLLGVDDFFML